MIESKVSEPIPSRLLRPRFSTIIAEDFLLDKEEVEKVIAHQFKMVREATNKYAEIEIYRFGKIIIRQSRLRQELDKIENILITSKKKYEIEVNNPEFDAKALERLRIAIDNREKDVEFMKSKLREPKIRKKRPDRSYKNKQPKPYVEINITDDFNESLDS
jgi:nucleoid DNA-binding protein